MENSKDCYAALIKLIERLSLLYIERVSHPSLSGKLFFLTRFWVAGQIFLLLAILFATTAWWGLMAVLFLYMQLYEWPLITALLFLIAINTVSLLLIVVICSGYFKMKKQHL